jgi:tellurite resistance protein TerC
VIVWLWTGFVAAVLAMLAVDLGVFHRRSRAVRLTEAALWTAVWVVLALAFNVAVYYLYEHHVFGIGAEIGHRLTGRQAALKFFTGYLIEKSLSLDNIFIIALIFAYFGVRAEYQHRVLFWGILGALVLRGLMIAAGTALIHRFSWVTYAFGVLLILTALKMLVARHDNLQPDRNPLVRLARRLYPVSGEFEGPRFFTRIDGRRAITPLFLVLLVVESSDVLFAIDSIPAIFAITSDPFLVFTSNIFAILGLRSLYFVLAGVMARFRYLKMSLVFLLVYVGVKMLLAHHHPIPTFVSLAIIAGILSVGVLASVLAGHRDSAPLASPPTADPAGAAGPSWKPLRRVGVTVLGVGLLIVGAAMIVLPGPALVVIPAGLAILGTEFLWARRLQSKMTKRGVRMLKRIAGQTGQTASDSGRAADSAIDERRE